IQRLREAAEKAKIELSTTLDTDINLPFISGDASGPKHLVMKFTRAKLETLVHSIVERCRGPVNNALSDAKLEPKNIDKIIMVGGPTRMPAVQEFVENLVGKKVEHGVDPMECVAMGAGIQAAVLTGDIKDVLLLDVTPLSLGIETLGNVFTKLIERNTTIPTKKSQIFSTAADSQPSVEIHILQGERQMAPDNTSLGRFQLVGIPPAPRGFPQIEVTFDIDANGILHVSAKDLGTGKEQSMKITAPTKLSKEDIDKMVKQAEQFSEDDKKKKEKAEVVNQADTLIYSTEKALSEHGSKLDEATRKSITDAITDLKTAMKSDDADKIKTASESLSKVSMKLGEMVYAQSTKGQQGQQGQPQQEPNSNGNPQAGTEEPKKDENVVDAEYKVEDDKK
ncbi:MAG: Hsp70 family protein, partial [Candidatus Firestonebacteria bacterium]